MRLSVITVVRNVLTRPGAEDFRRCLESVSRLDVEHEHIVQDGASTDETVALFRFRDFIRLWGAGKGVVLKNWN